MKFESKYKQYQKKVNEALNLYYPSDFSRAAEAAKYSLLAGGKRLRPIIMLAFFEALTEQKSPPEIIQLACSLEYAHTFSLIHDDLPAIDNDDLRRGLKTCHKQFDEATAILAGDYLLNLTYWNIGQAELDQVAQSIAITELSSAVKMLIMGEMRDIEGETRKFIPKELEITYVQKTSSLFIAAFVIIAGILEFQNGGDELSDRALNLGRKLGLAFQVQDDVLNVIGDEAQLGKKTGSDQVANKQTWVSEYGLKKAQKYYCKCYDEVAGELDDILFANQAKKFLLELIAYLKNRQS